MIWAFFTCASIQLFMFIFGFLVQKKFLISQILSAALWSLLSYTALFFKKCFLRLFFAIKNYHNRIINPLLCYVLSIQSNWEFFKENCYWKILLFSESKLMKNKSYQNDIQNKYKYSIQLVLLTYNFNLRVFLVGN